MVGRTARNLIDPGMHEWWMCDVDCVRGEPELESRLGGFTSSVKVQYVGVCSLLW